MVIKHDVYYDKFYNDRLYISNDGSFCILMVNMLLVYFTLLYMGIKLEIYSLVSPQFLIFTLSKWEIIYKI